MKNIPKKQLILTIIFAVLTFVATLAIRIPIPGVSKDYQGYINLGDCFVLMSSFIIGPYYGAFAAGIGSAFTDFFGAAIYSPITFILKALMALLTGLMFRIFKKKSVIWIAISAFIGEALMVLGYYFFESFMLGLGWGTAALGIPANIFQAITAVAVSTLFAQAYMSKKEKSPKEDSDKE